jgi:hypothetical protein
VGAGQPAKDLKDSIYILPCPLGYVHFCTAKVNPVGIAKLLVIWQHGANRGSKLLCNFEIPQRFWYFFRKKVQSLLLKAITN